MTTGLFLMTGTCAEALIPLSDEGLAETHAASGIRLTFDDLVINHTADEVGYIAYENQDSLGQGQGNYGSLGLSNFSMTLRAHGTVDLEAKSFTFPEESNSYFATDFWKEDEFVHVSKTHTLDKVPQFNSADRQVVVVEASGLGGAFLTVGPDGSPVSGQLQARYGTESDIFALGTLGISNLQLIDQRMILYAMPEIAGHCSGEGLAMEIGMRLSIESVKIASPHDESLTFFEMKGFHLRESFEELDPAYDHLGNYKENENIGAMYADSTGDSGGYEPGDKAALLEDYEDMSGTWGSTAVPTGKSVNNMYDGRFMIGNLRQVGFIDYVAGNKEVPVHRNHKDQLAWNDRASVWGHGWDDQEFSAAAPVHRVDDADRVDYSEIVERPATLSIKKRTRDESPDESSCMVLNMPLHGSIRVEQVVGYNLGDDSDYLGGSSMGPLIVEGLRVKKLYIEFPGRNTTYELETAVNESISSDPNTYLYSYRSGRLPVLQDLPEGQKEYNPMGRGVAEFADRLRPEPGPWNDINDHAQGVTAAPVDSGWAQYRTVLNGKSFWQLREPYPINSNYAIYKNSP